MKIEEAFRVAAIPGMSAASDIQVFKAVEKAKALIHEILSPLRLGARLSFSLHEDPNGQGWVLVRIQRSGQMSLFAEFETTLTLAATQSLEAASAIELLKNYLAELKLVMQQFRISGYQLEEVAKRMTDVARLRAAFGIQVRDQERVRVEYGATPAEYFALSPEPGMHILPEPRSIRFEIDQVGRRKAGIVLEAGSQAAIGAKRRAIALRWGHVDQIDDVVQFFVDRMKAEAATEASVKLVLNSKGVATGLLLQQILES